MSLTPDVETIGPLTADEFAWLEAVLARGTPQGWMSVEAVDGYFAALVCAPVRASSGLLFGPVFAVEVMAEAALTAAEHAGVESLLWRHWRTLVATLERALVDPAIAYQPLVYEDEGGSVDGGDWARGFLRGVADDLPAWAGFESVHAAALAPVRQLAGAIEGDTRAGPDRTTGLAAIAAMLVTAYRHFEVLRG
jgi:uncharacterized protein